MRSYIIKRILLVIPIVLCVILIVFIFQGLSIVDPVEAILGVDAPVEAKAALRAQYGLDKSIPVQYVTYIWNIVSKGSFGFSYRSGNPITQELLVRFPVTIKLAVLSVLLGIILGIPLGVISAAKQYSVIDNIILFISVIAAAMPQFWLALLLISLFAVNLHILPAAGITSWTGWILPVISIAVTSMSMICRNTRASMLEAIRQDYVRTARSKGQTEVVVVMKHALRNSLMPIITNIGSCLGRQLGGALVIETIFGLPGIGKYAYDAILIRDYPAVMGSVVILAFFYTIINLLVDLSYTVIDPRVKTTFISQQQIKKNKKLFKKISQGEM